MARFPRFRAGDTFGLVGPGRQIILDERAAKLLNDAAAEMRRLGRVASQHPLRWSEGIAGRRLELDTTPGLWAKLDGVGPLYNWLEQAYEVGVGWSNKAGGQSGEAIELNETTGLGGKVVWLRQDLGTSEWLFQWLKQCCVCPVTFRLVGCNLCRIAGANVDWVLDGVTVFSGTTDANGEILNPATAPGNYTFNWSIPGTALSGTATDTVTTPCITNRVVVHTISVPPGYTCYSNCAIPYPQLFITDPRGGTRAFGDCVEWTNPDDGLMYSIIVLLSSTGSCGSPQWTLTCLSEFPTVPPPHCPQTDSRVALSIHPTSPALGCARPFSFAGTYAINGNNVVSNQPFLIHE